MIGDLRAVERETLGQFGPQFLADIGHVFKACGPEILAPARDLLGPHRGLLGVEAHGFQLGLERGQGHAGQGFGSLGQVGALRKIKCGRHEIAL